MALKRWESAVTSTKAMTRGHKTEIADCISAFETAVLKHSEFMFKDSDAANKQYDIFVEALRQLNKIGDDGLSALVKLLDNDNIVVRVTTACYLIHYRTDEALMILSEAAKLDRGIAMLAQITLKRWQLGRYLDPASGKEVTLKGRKDK
jgi:hypothetical protein